MKRRNMMKTVVIGALGAATLGTGEAAVQPGPQERVKPKPLEDREMAFWLESSLGRVFPNSEPGSAAPLQLLAARNERISFQTCLRNRKTTMVRVRAAVENAEDLKPVIRRVGYVPLQGLDVDVPKDEIDGVGYIPGLVPDPLYPEATANVGPEANASFWITLTVPADAAHRPPRAEGASHGGRRNRAFGLDWHQAVECRTPRGSGCLLARRAAA